MENYLKNQEAFYQMRNLFNQLYSNELEFKKIFNKDKKVGLEVTDDVNMVYSINSSNCKINLSRYNWDIGDDYPTYLQFSEIFLYDKYSAFLYTGGLVIERSFHPNFEGFVYRLPKIVSSYPKIEDILVNENNRSSWKYVKGIPNVFKKLLLSLGSEYLDYSTVVKIYNSKDNLIVEAINPEKGTLMKYVYGGTEEIDVLLEDIVQVLGKLSVPVSEVFILRLGKLQDARLRKNSTGEYTLVVE